MFHYLNLQYCMEDFNNSGEGVEPVEILKNEKSSKESSKQYSIHGYLMKHNDKTFVKGLKSPGTVARKRWFVYSDATCKLYYYKSEKDHEPLGEIDIAIASLSYNVENSTNSLFTISSNGKDYTLEASSPQMRLYWLQQLQTARREFNERISLGNFKSGVTCIGRPESGLLQDLDPLPEPSPDPNDELNAIMSKSMDSGLKNLNEQSSFKSKSNMNLPLKILKSPFNSTKSENFVVPNVTCESEPASPRAPRSPILSPTTNNNFDKFSNRLRTSFRIRKPKFGKFNSDSPEEECKKCIQLQEELRIANERVSQFTDRCDAHKEAIILLQKDLESTQKEKNTLGKLINHSVTDDDILTIFREKDRKIVELEHLQHQLKNSLSSLTSDLRDSRIHCEHLQEKLNILLSLVESKDNAIVELSRDLEGYRNSSSHLQTKTASSSSTFYSTSPVHSYPRAGTISIGTQTNNVEYEDLLDKLEGYKCQNTFLNKEILDLNHIFKHRNEREQKLIAESSTWEAKFYQIQSKYLLLLNDLHSPQSTQHDSSVLSQLLQDVVDSQGTADLRVVKRQGKGYNEYGFCVSAPETDILSKAEFLQKQSKANAWLAQQQKFSGISVNYESQWESFLAVNNAKELPQHPDLKYLIREGIPYQYKGKVWRLLIEYNIGKYKATLSPTYYQDLLARRNTTSTLDPAAKQIELDLLRTLPNNRHYESPYSDGIPKLRRVLLAYSRHNMAVGYCQGLNRLGAIALLFLNEEDAFWCLVYIIEFLMPPDFYTRNLFASQVDQRVLKDLINDKLPRLCAHFEQHELDISLFSFNWFLCVYVDAIPPSTYLYIWDSFLYEGSKVLFRFAIAIFKLCEEDILGKKDYMSIFDYLRSVPEQVANLHKLKQIAFEWTNPLSKKYIRNKREYYKVIVKAELDEVEEVRKSYYQNKKEDKRNESEKDDDDSREEKPDDVKKKEEKKMKEIAPAREETVRVENGANVVDRENDPRLPAEEQEDLRKIQDKESNVRSFEEELQNDKKLQDEGDFRPPEEEHKQNELQNKEVKAEFEEEKQDLYLNPEDTFTSEEEDYDDDDEQFEVITIQ